MEINKELQLRPLRILLVEDTLDLREILTQVLEVEGMYVSTACDGKEGLKKALSETFDVILMDMQMPVLDGLSATQALRKKNYSKPIVALTAFSVTDESQRLSEAGFDAILGKPIDIDVLLTTLRSYA